jgi:C1A family cysteine protease
MYKAVHPGFNPSRLFLYYVEREREHSTDKDNGANENTLMICMRDTGIAPEVSWPYDTDKVLEKPTIEAYQLAPKNKISGFIRIMQNRDLLIKCLLDGRPFLFGFNLGKNFRDKVGKTGVYNKEETEFIGAHCVLCVGYSNEKKSFLIANSWGTKWGLSGYFLFHEDLIVKTSVTTAFFTYV